MCMHTHTHIHTHIYAHIFRIKSFRYLLSEFVDLFPFSAKNSQLLFINSIYERHNHNIGDEDERKIKQEKERRKKDSQPNRKQDSTPRRIKRIETEADKSSEDEEFIRKMTDNIKIHKIKTKKAETLKHNRSKNRRHRRIL